MANSILSSRPVLSALTGLFAGYIWLVYRTTRWRVEGEEHLRAVSNSPAGIVGCIWHNRLMLTAAIWPNDAAPARAMVSKSADGDLIAGAAARFGAGAVRGSSFDMKKRRDKGALAAFREMLRHVRQGGCAAVTPDGPRGPRMSFQEGAVRLAQVSGAPMIMLAWSTSAQIRFNSWDRFILPLPFGRGRIIWSEPLHAPDRADEAATEAFRQRAEALLIDITAAADAAVGCEPIEPAGLKPEAGP